MSDAPYGYIKSDRVIQSLFECNKKVRSIYEVEHMS